MLFRRHGLRRPVMSPTHPPRAAAAPQQAAPAHALGFSPNRRLDIDEVLATLRHEGVISDAEVKRVRGASRTVGRTELHPLVVVANAKLEHAAKPGFQLTLDWLTQWLAHHAGLPHVHIDPTKIDVARVGQVVTAQYATRYRILPIEISDTELTIATSEPFDTRWLGDLAHILRREVKRVVANPLDVNRYLMEFYGVTSAVRKAKDAKDAKGEDTAGKVLNLEQLLELGGSGEIGADDQHIVRIVDWLLQYAYEQHASDIHLEPRRDTSRVRFRIDGVLHKVFELPTPVMAAVTSRIKILGRMDIAERRRPQDGRIKMRTPGGREVEMRLSTMPTAFGEKCVMRIFDPELVLKNFSQLGFNAQEEAIWRAMVERPHGIVLVTGPTGSGKTTTLYSTLKYLATPDLNVCTIEDPIEMVAPEFNQMQVQASIDLTFAAGVRTLLRQDPDIIMVGEIRDLETAEMAIQAALTGHLVLSTLHTNDAPSAISRLLDLGAQHFLIQGTVAGIVAQRLVRRLCPKCKVEGPLDERQWATLTQGFGFPPPTKVFRPVGCADCRKTGYQGRTAIYEMMPISPVLRSRIHPSMDLPAFRAAALSEGLRPLRLSAAEQVAKGVTTLEEVLTVLPTTE
ncbi:MAG TPA: GspE/PulE family protein [Xanthomonadales bacterium]|nr:GspE/PulE family protein [Xanthomonadales bacterium]